MKTKCLIIGSGPAGYTAAIYASRANLEPVLIEGFQPGGQLTTTGEVENFPGYPQGVDGNMLMDDLRKQALRFGTNIQNGQVTKVDFSKRPFTLTTDTATYEADTVIISTGATARYLGLDDEQKYMGMGVSACAVCDGFFYRDKIVAVVGGGDSACEEATYLSGICKKVYLIVRKDYLRASKVMQRRVLDNTKISVLFNSNVIGLFGDPVLEGAHIIEYAGTEREQKYDIPINGLFLAIGHDPNSKPFSEYVATDPQGFIIVNGQSQATSVPGVFAAGDVCDPTYQQAVVAAASGCKAALDAERFYIENQA
ncbi:MAG: thioredoxin-disulfide reductase [Bacteroidales bacterium]|nr:thioredoxin-disulfide reductase [Bacteroidales bacterium]